MHWLAVLAVAICFVLGSWLWLKPSPEQKRIANLRTTALAEGVQVKLVGSMKLPVAGLEPFWAVYLLPASRGSLSGWSVKLEPGTDLPHTLVGMPTKLQSQIMALGVHAGSPFIVWNERGGIADLGAIKQLLNTMREAA